MLASPNTPPIADTAGLIYIEVLAGSPDGSEPPVIAEGRLLRASSRELRISIPEALRTGAIHELAVDVGNGAPLLFLTGEIASRKRIDDNGWELRLVLLRTAEDDRQNWEQLLHSMSPQTSN